MSPHRAVMLLLASAAACGRPGGRAEKGTITVTRAVVPGGASRAQAMVFLTIRNRATIPLRLTTARAAGADSVLFFDRLGERVVGGIEVPARSRVQLAPGGTSVVLEGLDHQLQGRDTVTVALNFAPGGEVLVRLPVLPSLPPTAAGARGVNGNSFVWWCAHVVGEDGMDPAFMQGMLLATLVLLAVPSMVLAAVVVWYLRHRRAEPLPS